MAFHKVIYFTLFLPLVFSFRQAIAQNPENWTTNQLMEPSTLAEHIRTGKEVPLIFSVGPGAIIPGSITIGMTKDSNNVKNLKNKLKGLPRNKNMVFYCGCCPFEHCPNIRPAIELLKELKFTNYHLLNLPHNIKTDWIDKGYPQMKS